MTTIKLKFNGRAKAGWVGDLVAATGNWLVVFFDAPGYTTRQGATVRYAIQHFSTVEPLTILACFDERGEVLEYQCDAALPANMVGREIRYVDLDLDLMVAPNLSYFARDHDDFTRNSLSMAYPPEVVAQAWAGMALATRLVKAGAFPFDGSAEAELGRALAAQGPL